MRPVSGSRRRLAAWLAVAAWAPACATAVAPRSVPSIAEPSVRSHMEFLASDALNGRGSGTRDELTAAEYVAAHLRRLGLQPLGDNGGYVQQVELETLRAAAPPVLTIGDRRLTHGAAMLVRALSRQRAAGVLQKFQPGLTARSGAFLLMPEGVSPPSLDAILPAAVLLTVETPQLRRQWAALGKTVPATPRMVMGSGAEVRLKPDATSRGEDATSAMPVRIVLERAAFESLTALADGTPMSFESDARVETSHTWNVVARLGGSDPAAADEALLLSAHLDHLGNRGDGDDTIFNGADDDASGTVAVMALAEALAAAPPPRRSVVFAWFGSEEAGGYGSQHFTDRPPLPLSGIVANLQFEMIGRPDAQVPPHSLWMTGYERSTLGPELASRGARIVKDPRPEQNFFERSDNIRLARRGVIAHAVSSFGLHTDYHRPSDELRQIDFAHMTAAIQSMLAPVRWLADSTFRPEWLPGQRP